MFGLQELCSKEVSRGPALASGAGRIAAIARPTARVVILTA